MEPTDSSGMTANHAAPLVAGQQYRAEDGTTLVVVSVRATAAGGTTTLLRQLDEPKLGVKRYWTLTLEPGGELRQVGPLDLYDIRFHGEE